MWFLPPAPSWWQRLHQCDRGVAVPSPSLVTLSPMSCYLSLWTPVLTLWILIQDPLHTLLIQYCDFLIIPYTPSVLPDCLHCTLLACNKLGQTHLPFFSTQALHGKIFSFCFLYLLPIITSQIHMAEGGFSVKATQAVKTNGIVFKHFHIYCKQIWDKWSYSDVAWTTPERAGGD